MNGNRPIAIFAAAAFLGLAGSPAVSSAAEKADGPELESAVVITSDSIAFGTVSNGPLAPGADLRVSVRSVSPGPGATRLLSPGFPFASAFLQAVPCEPPWYINEYGVCDLDFCAAGGGVITAEGCVYTVDPSSAPPPGPSPPHIPGGPQIDVGNIPQASEKHKQPGKPGSSALPPFTEVP